jgi:hypothetical protein
VTRILIRLLLRLYPRAWRERYGAEYATLLVEHGLGPRTVIDVLRGALDARLGAGGPSSLDARRRDVVVLGAWAASAYVAAGVGFQRMAEYEDFTRAARDHAGVAAGFAAVVAGAAVAGVALLAATAMLGWPILREAATTRRPDLIRPLAACVAGAVAFALAGITLVVIAHVAAPRPPHDPRNVALVAGWLALSSGAAAVAVSGATRAARRATLSGPVLRRSVACVGIGAAGMAMSLAGLALWGLALHLQSPDLFALGDGGVLATPTPMSWLAELAVMGAALAVVAIPLRRVHTRPSCPY